MEALFIACMVLFYVVIGEMFRESPRESAKRNEVSNRMDGRGE